MATDQDFVDYVAEQVGVGNRLTRKKMFGEYALYLDGKVVAFACDNSLFVKPSRAVANLGLDLPQRPPYPGAKDYPVADELLDDSDAIRRLIIETAALMPAPKPGKPRSAKPGGVK
jgi:TfoX/Sxy family transcriptional regulator of competence genes